MSDVHTPGVELAVSALSMRFGGLVAVDDVTFEVRTGEVLSSRKRGRAQEPTPLRGGRCHPLNHHVPNLRTNQTFTA